MSKVRIGVVGMGRGMDMMEYCRNANNAELVAICDKWKAGLNDLKKLYNDDNITYYYDFDEFLNHDMDAVILANYATEHAPFAVKALKKGFHVFSEVLPCQTIKQGIELIEAVEETGKIYTYAENYCFMAGPHKMRDLYKKGEIGEFEYAEGEYVHNCESIWPDITYGDPDHWRNNTYSTYYCTHSVGPIIHITGLRPVSVIGFEGHNNERQLRVGQKSGAFAIEMVQFENGGIAKSIHGGLYQNSIWYTLYGSKGRMETAREDAHAGDTTKLYMLNDEYSGQYRPEEESYSVFDLNSEECAEYGHGGSDYHCINNFCEKILGNSDADCIDVYEAMDMGLVGICAYKSILAGNKSIEIPNLRDPEIRAQYRNDTFACDKKVAGDMYVPPISTGEQNIPAEVYQRIKNEWLKNHPDK